jgi:hypothetical protein
LVLVLSGLVLIGEARADIGNQTNIGTDPTDGNAANVGRTAQNAQGTTSSYGVDVGVGETDNVTLVTTDKVSQTIATADADFTLKQQTGVFDDNLKGQFAYFDYLQHAYNSLLVGRFDGVADYSLIPQRLIWSVQDNYGEASLDPFAAQTPANLQYVNSFSTGPELDFRPGGATFLQLIARYERAQYQTSPLDSNRFLASFEWGVPLSPRSTVAFNANSERVLFENTGVNSDFDLSSAYASYEIHGARTDLTARLGLTRVDQQGTAASGGLANFELDRRVSLATTLSLSAGRDLTDALASFSNLQPGASGGITTAQAAVSSSVYTLSYAQLAWRFARNRTIVGLSARWENDQYSNDLQADVVGITQPVATEANSSALDSSRRGGEFNLEERLTRILSAQFLGSYYDQQYPHANFAITADSTRYEDSRLGMSLIFRPGRALDIRLRYQHIDRVISGVNSGTGYRDNVVFLTVGYRPRVSDDGGPAL